MQPHSLITSSAVATPSFSKFGPLKDFIYPWKRIITLGVVAPSSIENCAIILSDASLGKIRKLAVAAGTSTLGYLWQPSFVQGEPDRLAGIPVYASPFMPNQASTIRFGVIGDFSRYIIGQRSSMAVQVLREAYAASGQIGFRAVERIDAGATIYDAFRYIKAAT